MEGLQEGGSYSSSTSNSDVDFELPPAHFAQRANCKILVLHELLLRFPAFIRRDQLFYCMSRQHWLEVLRMCEAENTRDEAWRQVGLWLREHHRFWLPAWREGLWGCLLMTSYYLRELQ